MQLKIENVTKKYGQKVAVNKLSLAMEEGIYGLLGENGAGKTTLMKLLCSLQEPTSGQILLNNRSIKKNGEEYRKILGYLPQKFYGYSDFTVYQFLLYIAALKGLRRKESEIRANELLEIVGLIEERKKKIKHLSGGMNQRLGIAQAMLNNPCILILDEPTAGLDPEERINFHNLISVFSKNRIVILSTHIVSDVDFGGHNLIIMKQGRLVEYGKTYEILERFDKKVWECQVPYDKVSTSENKYVVSNIKSLDNNQMIMRIISEDRPMRQAIQVSPNLEDIYLDYCKEKRK